ncbi:zf-HC2 domain-containing protein [Catenuloplanes japonicus]|uniref:zf-HC2 domain-containing protein n=1 Tax=Catenuloplanes japonicus TaxID=33876 RepID=UPI00068B6610|nr:zf-HC2 domain-containing protein [Catenuloplanes japonicus]
MSCISDDLLARYATGDDLPEETLWVLEAHLETCPECRARMAVAIEADPELPALVESIRLEIAPRLGPGRGRLWQARHRLRRTLARWAVPAILPWLAMTVAVPLAATLLEAAGPDDMPPLLLLIAPLVPMLGVAVSWNRWTDPAHALVAVAPRSGLPLVLRRTLVALLVTLPPVALAGLAVGASPARWLLPGLAFTTVVLAVGALAGVTRAAIGVTVLWSLGVILPTLSDLTDPVLLDAAATPGWLAVIVCAAAALTRFRYRFQLEGTSR